MNRQASDERQTFRQCQQGDAIYPKTSREARTQDDNVINVCTGIMTRARCCEARWETISVFPS